MPGEAKSSTLEELPRTWIQVCTNDPLFGDGVDYARLLKSADVEVKLDVWEGFPHAFFHQYKEFKLSQVAEQEVLRGLDWILEKP
jgi:acetyl esterase/lipase